jgi:hypothetical protein
MIAVDWGGSINQPARRFIVSNASSRFSESGVMDDLIRDCVGWRKIDAACVVDYLFRSDMWASVLRGTNANPTWAATVLDRKGFLVVKHERRLTAWLAIGGVKQPFYWVSGRILDGD